MVPIDNLHYLYWHPLGHNAEIGALTTSTVRLWLCIYSTRVHRGQLYRSYRKIIFIPIWSDPPSAALDPLVLARVHVPRLLLCMSHTRREQSTKQRHRAVNMKWFLFSDHKNTGYLFWELWSLWCCQVKQGKQVTTVYNNKDIALNYTFSWIILRTHVSFWTIQKKIWFSHLHECFSFTRVYVSMNGIK